MSNRSIPLDKFPTTVPDKFIKTELYYAVGGPNYFSGGMRERGYYLSVSPIEDKGPFTSTIAFSGTCAMIEKTARYSASKLQALSLRVRNLPIYQTLIDHVKAKNNLRLGTDVPTEETKDITETKNPNETPVNRLEAISMTCRE
jgi:hypothetical protein